MVRWPTHIDHYLCRQLHGSSFGTRSHAVTNLNGDLCRTYCRIIDRINGKITYTENLTPNFVRCGNKQARCVDGVCVGLNFPSGNQVQPPPTLPPPLPESEDDVLDDGSVSNVQPTAELVTDTSTTLEPSNINNNPESIFSI
ncbi:hypothetical protein RDWZM_005322 [Blomia tropicalis]|uniref:Uncharacterized protein n=1 Tax=Blomia tropicalis TaxID=40697 RepID=A0A9Q0M5E5_BLOTA|nr:hypothetical protein BLOT_005810 [Blomia tropicalis]KAJ6219510.1 hypothetical protein RDWZM_005322 [Blomia tropicalis]